MREVEQRVQRLATSKSTQMDLPNAPQGVPDQFGDHLDALFDMIALAWQSNMTRVASFMLAKEVSMRTYPNLQITEAFHPLSHHANDPSKIERLMQIQNYHTQVFAKFIKKLSTTQDGDGTLLDHSIILYGSNMSNSDLHNNDPLPNVVLGKGYGRIKGGQHLQYPQDTPHANLLLTLLNRAGVPCRAPRQQHRPVRGGLMLPGRKVGRGALAALFTVLACGALRRRRSLRRCACRHQRPPGRWFHCAAVGCLPG